MVPLFSTWEAQELGPCENHLQERPKAWILSPLIQWVPKLLAPAFMVRCVQPSRPPAQWALTGSLIVSLKWATVTMWMLWKSYQDLESTLPSSQSRLLNIAHFSRLSYFTIFSTLLPPGLNSNKNVFSGLSFPKLPMIQVGVWINTTRFINNS